MRIDPLLDFTLTILPAENAPEISWIHSPLEWYRRGLGLCATAAWFVRKTLAKKEPVSKKPAAKIRVASCGCFFIASLYFYCFCFVAASIKMRRARQVTLRFLSDIFIRIALGEHGQH